MYNGAAGNYEKKIINLTKRLEKKKRFRVTLAGTCLVTAANFDIKTNLAPRYHYLGNKHH
jgi:nitrogenase molybdenum-iron protein alpha/beta subunit